MESDVELAVHHAVELASSRHKQLASITLRGSGAPHVVDAFARAALRRFNVQDAEVRFFVADGPVKLASVELHV